MSTIHKKLVNDFYEKSYKDLGLGAQRRYLNKELCRFMGRNFFKIQRAEKPSKFLRQDVAQAQFIG